MTAPWHLTAAEMDAAWDDLTARLAEAEALLRECGSTFNDLLDTLDHDEDCPYWDDRQVTAEEKAWPACGCWKRGVHIMRETVRAWLSGQQDAYLPPDSAPAVECKWTQDLDGNWATGCGQMWCLIDGTPADNDMTYCHHCGKRIKESLYLDPDDDGIEADQPELTVDSPTAKGG